MRWKKKENRDTIGTCLGCVCFSFKKKLDFGLTESRDFFRDFLKKI
jgi:hypothetical protein